jgi:hypothetical protein
MCVKAERRGRMWNLGRPCGTCVVGEADRWVGCISYPIWDSLVVKERRSLGASPRLCRPMYAEANIEANRGTRPVSSDLFPLIMFVLAQEEIEVATLVGLQYGILE